MIHTAEPMASLVCECLRGSKVQCPAGWDAGTLLLHLSFLHDQSDQSDQSNQSAIPLINYHNPWTNGGAALREQSAVCYRTTERQPGCGEGAGVSR